MARTARLPNSEQVTVWVTAVEQQLEDLRFDLRQNVTTW
jgi:hypothetical protein